MGTQLKTLGAFVSEREYQTLWSAAPLLNGRAHAIQLVPPLPHLPTPIALGQRYL